MRKKYLTIDEFISDFPKETQTILQKIRRTIKKVVPEATEKISYNIPTFVLNGTYLIYFAGFSKHISLYPITSGSDSFNKKIKPYLKGKGTLQFPLNEPIPYDLIEEIVKEGLKANIVRTKSKKNN